MRAKSSRRKSDKFSRFLMWMESQMIIDFRLHTSDNASTENGVQIAVYSMSLSHSLAATLFPASFSRYNI